MGPEGREEALFRQEARVRAAGQAERWAVRVGWRHGCRAASTAERAGAPAVRPWEAPLAARAAGRADTPPPHDDGGRNAAAWICPPWPQPCGGHVRPSYDGAGSCLLRWTGLPRLLARQGPNPSALRQTMRGQRTLHQRALHPKFRRARRGERQYPRPASGLWWRGAVHPVAQSSEGRAGRESPPVSPPPAAISAAYAKGGWCGPSEQPELLSVRAMVGWPKGGAWLCFICL